MIINRMFDASIVAQPGPINLLLMVWILHDLIDTILSEFAGFGSTSSRWSSIIKSSRVSLGCNVPSLARQAFEPASGPLSPP